MISSTPNYVNFLPLANQAEVLYDVEEFDYSNGILEFMLSGSVGSNKSTILSNLIVDHCVKFPGAHAGIGRLAMPALKGTLCNKIREHLFETGIQYSYNETTGNFKFANGSSISAFSWMDKKYHKFRSHEFSAFAFEELSENTGDHKAAYVEVFQRMGRMPHIPQCWIASATNPDSPSHWAYKYFIKNQRDNRRVYYSKTKDNPFLPKSYIKNLRETLDPKMAKRMIEGQWIEIADEVIYYAYESEHNFRDETYTVDASYPIYICFDFNIAKGKPLSIAFAQNIKGICHIFNEVVIEGLNTRKALLEAKDRGLLDYRTHYIIHGDATGKSRDTRNNHSDYDIIEEVLEDLRVIYELDVSRKNPPIRERHNLVNGAICNAEGTRRLFVYKDAPTADEGFRLACLKNGSKLIEDDGPAHPYQHITTAIGYHICEMEKNKQYQGSRSGMITF